jgi:hypothetical protein
MAIDRIGSVGPSGETPEPGRIQPKAAVGSPAFSDMLVAAMEKDIREAIKPERSSAELIGCMLGYNDAQLVLAMSIIASWEVGRREAVRADMEARQHEAGMQRLLAEFAKQVTIVSPATGAAQVTVDQQLGQDRLMLEIALRLQQQGKTGDEPPTSTEKKED